MIHFTPPYFYGIAISGGVLVLSKAKIEQISITPLRVGDYLAKHKTMFLCSDRGLTNSVGIVWPE